MSRPVVGIDPGGRHTGIVVRHIDTLLAVELVERHTKGFRPDRDYLEEVVTVTGRLRGQHDADVAVEDLHAPGGRDRHGKKHPLDPAGVVGVAVTLGAVLLAFHDIIEVAPGGNGSAPLAAYPPELIGGAHNPRWPRPEPRGAGMLRHARSAWDVAGGAAIILATRARQRRTA